MYSGEVPPPPNRASEVIFPNENKTFKTNSAKQLFRKMSTQLSVWRVQGHLFLFQVHQLIS